MYLSFCPLSHLTTKDLLKVLATVLLLFPKYYKIPLLVSSNSKSLDDRGFGKYCSQLKPRDRATHKHPSSSQSGIQYTLLLTTFNVQRKTEANTYFHRRWHTYPHRNILTFPKEDTQSLTCSFIHLGVIFILLAKSHSLFHILWFNTVIEGWHNLHMLDSRGIRDDKMLTFDIHIQSRKKCFLSISASSYVIVAGIYNFIFP